MKKTGELFSFFKYKNKLIPWLLYKPQPMAPHYYNSQGCMQMNVWHFIFKVVPETWTELVCSVVCVHDKVGLKKDAKTLRRSGQNGKEEKKKRKVS